MQTNPKIGDGNTETCKIPRFAMKSETVHGQGAKQNHSCNTKFVVQGSSGTPEREQDQRRLCSNGVIVVTLSDEDVEANQDEQEDAQGKISTKRGSIQPSPVMHIEGKSVEDFHRNDDPCHAKQMHGWIWNPFFSSPQSGKTHDDEQWSSKEWRQCGSNYPPQNGPNKDHSGKKAVPEPPFSMNGHIGHTVRCCGFIHGSITLDGSGFVGLLVLRAEQGGDLSNGFIRIFL